MPNLFLYTLHKNQYLDNSACAYIYYGTKKKPLDHHGKAIGTFSDDPFSHVKYLSNHVLSKLNNALQNTNYIAIDVELINQAPHPFFNVQRRDGRNLSELDLVKINNDLTTALTHINKNANKHEEKPGMFATKSKPSHKDDLNQDRHEKKATNHR